MPWSVRKDPRCGSGYAVVKDSNNEVVACHNSKKSAIAQQRALYASEAKKENTPKPADKPNDIWAGRFVKPKK